MKKFYNFLGHPFVPNPAGVASLMTPAKADPPEEIPKTHFNNHFGTELPILTRNIFFTTILIQNF